MTLLQRIATPKQLHFKPQEKVQKQFFKESEENTKQFISVFVNGILKCLLLERALLDLNKNTFPLGFSPTNKSKWLTMENC